MYIKNQEYILLGRKIRGNIEKNNAVFMIRWLVPYIKGKNCFPASISEYTHYEMYADRLELWLYC